MTIRFYVLPIIVYNGMRGPKYFCFGIPPSTGITCLWSMRDYGSINQAVLCADILAADHTALVANADVLSIPVNIDSTLTTPARNTARNFLESYNIPAGWVITGMTYRAVLRTVTGFFLFFQRINGILEHDIELPAGWLEYEVRNIPEGIRAAMIQYADENGIEYSPVTPTTTMRTIMNYMSVQRWSIQPILFGLATL